MSVSKEELQAALFAAFEAAGYFYSYDDDCDWVCIDGDYSLGEIAKQIVFELTKEPPIPESKGEQND